ncbi:MAG: response regulator [Maledivibacter sp.]|jgi:two-component system response regulator YesN|nr:response regulator [Maledivibacter sp.]
MYKLMIVDDEPLTREYMKINVPRLDQRWTVSAEAMEGTEALTILQNEKIDLIITDIKMPIMDGLKLCELIHKEFPNQKVVILSGFEEFEFAKKAMTFGVKDYILKPIVKSDLKNLLNDMAIKIEKDSNREITFKAMMDLSNESRKQIVRNFLKAVVTNSYIEVKSLYPILFKMKENLIESDASIMLLSIDEEVFLQNSMSTNEIHILKFILNEMVSNIFQGEDSIKVFCDDQENTLILINIDNNKDFNKEYSKIFNTLSKAFLDKTGITISCGVGEPENEVLQLHSSYQKALTILKNKLIKPQKKLYIYSEDNNNLDKILKIDDALSLIKSSILNNDSISYNIALSNYINLIEDFTLSNILIFGIHMLKSLHGLDSTKDEYSSLAMNKLKDLCSSCNVDLTHTQVLSIYKEVGNLFNKSYNKLENEGDIVSTSKEYIYAHYKEPLSLALIADKLCVSPSYLSSVFHKNVGEPYTKFITRIRMEEAAKLFRTDYKIKVYDVAERVGYISVKHFSHIFKKYYNLSPSEYKTKFTLDI